VHDVGSINFVDGTKDSAPDSVTGNITIKQHVLKNDVQACSRQVAKPSIEYALGELHT
jgi:hypothetical protein